MVAALNRNEGDVIVDNWLNAVVGSVAPVRWSTRRVATNSGFRGC